MSAWVFQDPKQIEKHGQESAAWSVGWYDPEGKRRCKSCGLGSEGKRNAEKLRKKIDAELLTGTYQSNDKKTWEEFRKEYDARILPGMCAQTRRCADSSLRHFERVIAPKRMVAIKTQAIDDFIAVRRKEPGLKEGSLLSPASINHDLRHIKAAMAIAVEWGYLPAMPKFRMEKVLKELPTYITGDHFGAIYGACDQTKLPTGLPFPAGDWWRALLVMGYMTGWRIGDMLGLRRDDLDLDKGEAITRARDNKGKRDERVKLHPVVVEHLRKLASFETHVFPWNYNRRTLHARFMRLQEIAGIHLPCQDAHKHTRYCHVYGFHDLRRAFATMNADKLTPDALQTLMRHKSYQTTQVYINMARQMDAAVAVLHVPDVLKERIG
ncbi:MAG TPA: site-specific integrase [Gemmataceae bacterium]|nr:site-specific integrase [Gemmataceae bacterium]